MNIHTIILAAGKGTRMNTNLPKVMQPLGGRTLISHVIQTAKKNRIPIYSYPEFIRKSSDNKHRIVIAGSHGKTTVTSIIMHVLKKNKIKFDYVIGGRANGFTSNIKISDIFFAVDERVKTIGCEKHSKKGCNGKTVKCITHDLWDELEGYINNFFEKKSLRDLLNQSTNRL